MTAPKHPGRRKVSEATVPYGAFNARNRVAGIIQLIGSTKTAELLGVSKSQPARWASGAERISDENMRRVLDLDFVLMRLLLNWHPEVAVSWLYGHNPFINGRPIDALKRQGASALFRALDAEDQGAYA
jgi:hypothetical protein